ncbi:MAG: hypothetical protein LH475_13345 [Cryobacterium sp.]|uniref:hypothetical protein n=1 Tax=Cryobacterium sp. TaxID=1926290 RepID=UPI002298D16E|nr:hypothetical protein [Cryobacterium sp.]MCY7405583.1 hypothetical protein [Cryobacterium sp.]
MRVWPSSTFGRAGFAGEIPDAELYLQAMAASAFVPIMQYHSEFNHHRTPSVDRTPWNIAERTGDDRDRCPADAPAVL